MNQKRECRNNGTLDVGIPNHDVFSELEIGQTASYSEGFVWLSIYPPSDCSSDDFSGISGTQTLMPGSTTVTRLSGDQWKVEVERQLRIIEFGYVITQKVVGKKVTTSCSIASNGSDGIQTTPVKFTMIWTRD